MFGSMKRKRKSFGRNNKDTNTATFHTTLALQKGHGKTKKVEEDFDSIFHGGEKEGCGKEEETVSSTKPSLGLITPSLPSRLPVPPKKGGRTISSFFASVQKPIDVLKKPSKATGAMKQEEITDGNASNASSSKTNSTAVTTSTTAATCTSTTLSSKTQYYLDFGQRGFNESIKCPVCDTLYQPSIVEEKKKHDRVCDEYGKGVVYVGRKKFKEICKDVNRKGREVEGGRGETVYKGPGSNSLIFRIVKVNNKVERVKDIVDKEMGFVDEESPLGLVYYLNVEGDEGRVTGMVTVHRLDKAYGMVRGKEEGVVEREREEVGVKIGVHQMWTHNKHRGKGVCTKLIDIARETMIYGEEVGRDEVAFSSPTGDGIKMANKYKGEDGKVYVYDC